MSNPRYPNGVLERDIDNFGEPLCPEGIVELDANLKFIRELMEDRGIWDAEYYKLKKEEAEILERLEELRA